MSNRIYRFEIRFREKRFEVGAPELTPENELHF